MSRSLLRMALVFAAQLSSRGLARSWGGGSACFLQVGAFVSALFCAQACDGLYSSS